MSETRAAREARPDDYDHFVRLVPELGVDDPTPPFEKWADEMMANTLMLEDEGAVVGYVYFKLLARDVYVQNLVVAKGARRRGAGRLLMGAVAARARSNGYERWELNVKIENAPAIALYSSLGFSKAYESAAMRLGWDVVDRLSGEEGSAARAVHPAEEAALEAAFGLPNGRIAELRARAGWVLLRLVEEARPDEARVGFACFKPDFPGSFPFQVARPTLARPLFEAIRPHARREHDFTQVVVESDPALRSALVAAGAEIRMDMLHMSGPIPAMVR